jgi:hypothetical protein
MEIDISEILNFFLPIGIIDHFDLVKIKEFNNENGLHMEIYFDEKHQYPEGYQDGELESKGFHELIKTIEPWCVLGLGLTKKSIKSNHLRINGKYA